MHVQLHHGVGCGVYLLILCVSQVSDSETYGLIVAGHKLHGITLAELVALAYDSLAVIAAALHYAADIRVGEVVGVGVVLTGLTVVKAGGVFAVADLMHSSSHIGSKSFPAM